MRNALCVALINLYYAYGYFCLPAHRVCGAFTSDGNYTLHDVVNTLRVVVFARRVWVGLVVYTLGFLFVAGVLVFEVWVCGTPSRALLVSSTSVDTGNLLMAEVAYVLGRVRPRPEKKYEGPCHALRD